MFVVETIRQIFCSTGRPVEFYQTSSRTFLLDVQQTYFSATSVAEEAHALARTVYWTSSRGFFTATGRPVEKNSTGRPVEWFYWTSSRADDLGHCHNSLLEQGLSILIALQKGFSDFAFQMRFNLKIVFIMRVLFSVSASFAKKK